MIDGIDLAPLRDRIGQTETTLDHVSLEHARAIAVTLNHDTIPQPNDPLPPVWHWTYFRPNTPTRDIGRDGHPKLGGFLPPIPLPRRMWVGGTIDFLAAPRIGTTIKRKTTISDVTLKSGRNGHLVFLTLEHDISCDGKALIREVQNIVYREAAKPRTEVPARVLHDAATPERSNADWREAMTPDPVLLFRYSALTFNSHRIHYDRTYAQLEEGYPDLVVHGPLTATLLVGSLIAKHGSALKSFSFRAKKPLFCDESLAICGEAIQKGNFDLWAETPGGEIAMSAKAVY